MGVDCEIYLPGDLDDMALSKAIGVFAGLPKSLVERQGGSSGSYVVCEVEGTSTKPTHTSMMGEIVLQAAGGKKTLVDGDYFHTTFFHWASRFRKQTWVSLQPRSTPFWIAIGKRLVDWFGGVMVYADCSGDEAGNVYEGKRTHPVDEDGFYPHDAEAWSAYQKALSKQTAVSALELREAWKHSAYKDSYPRSGKMPRPSKASV